MPPRTQSRDPETDLSAFLGQQLKEIRIGAGYKSQDEFASVLSKDRSVVGKSEDELALHRLIGTPEIMREQVEHLLELSKRPNIHIHILPARTGANAGLGGPIHLATGIGSPEVLLVGALIEDQVSADPMLVKRASATFDGVRGDALNRADSRNALMEAHERWNS